MLRLRRRKVPTAPQHCARTGSLPLTCAKNRSAALLRQGWRYGVDKLTCRAGRPCGACSKRRGLLACTAMKAAAIRATTLSALLGVLTGTPGCGALAVDELAPSQSGGMPAGGTGGGTSPSSGGASSSTAPRIYRPTESPLGRSHQDWLAAFFQWYLSIPKSTHPRDGGDCRQNQSGEVWFLTTGHNHQATTRTCRVPAGVSLFVATTASITYPMPDCGYCEQAGDPETWFAKLPSEVEKTRLIIAGDINTFETDGHSFDVGPQYLWATEGPFLAAAPPEDPYFFCTGPMSQAACGWPAAPLRPFGAAAFAVMLEPLTPGPHTIRFGATATTFDWDTDVTYEILVE